MPSTFHFFNKSIRLSVGADLLCVLWFSRLCKPSRSLRALALCLLLRGLVDFSITGSSAGSELG